MDAWGIWGKVAFVTGAAQGIGEAVARALADAGAHVAAMDRNAAGLKAVVADLRAGGFRADGYPADVRDGAAVEEAVERIEREAGPIGILVHAAGVLRTGPAVALADEDWAETMAVNVGGTFHVCRSVARRMAARRAGAIVVIGSNVAATPRMSMSAYAASKAAATMFVKCLGLELAACGVRCNIVSPGSTDTEMQRSLWTGGNGPAQVVAGSPETFRVGIPLGRIASPADISDAVVFLVSDRARHITLHDLRVDGGATLGV